MAAKKQQQYPFPQETINRNFELPIILVRKLVDRFGIEKVMHAIDVVNDDIKNEEA